MPVVIMMNKYKIAILLLSILLILSALMVDNRRYLVATFMAVSGGEPPPLLEPADELPTTVRPDDYFTIDEIAPNTFAIGEPRYYQQNYSYLVVGNKKALLFDAGPGIRNIREIAESLTDLPIVFLPSHFHFDHVGNGIAFNERAVVDLPYLRNRAVGNELTFAEMEHLGAIEGFETPTWSVDYWWKPGDAIQLGDRELYVVHTPGHSKESISLLDTENQLLLTGDYLYTGPLYVYFPGASMQDYLNTASNLLAETPGLRYFGAHRIAPPGPPELSQQDLMDLKRSLELIRDGKLQGEGLWPTEYNVNEDITILADPRYLQDWTE